jgi:hypothetical protein
MISSLSRRPGRDLLVRRDMITWAPHNVEVLAQGVTEPLRHASGMGGANEVVVSVPQSYR